MDPVSMIAGAAIASVFWLAVTPSGLRWADRIRPDEGVWIVSQDVEVDHQILGVFGTEPEATAHMRSVATGWPDGAVLMTPYPLGRDNPGSGYSR